MTNEDTKMRDDYVKNLVNEDDIVLAQCSGDIDELRRLIHNDNPDFAQWRDVAQLEAPILTALLNNQIIASGVEFKGTHGYGYGYIEYFNHNNIPMYTNVEICIARLIVAYRAARVDYQARQYGIRVKHEAQH